MFTFSSGLLENDVPLLKTPEVFCSDMCFGYFNKDLFNEEISKTFSYQSVKTILGTVKLECSFLGYRRAIRSGYSLVYLELFRQLFELQTSHTVILLSKLADASKLACQFALVLFLVILIGTDTATVRLLLIVILALSNS